MEDKWNSWSQGKVWKTKKDFRSNGPRPGEKNSHHWKRVAEKSSKHRSSIIDRTIIQHTLNNKDLHGRVARKKTISTKNVMSDECRRKHWEAWKPFGTMCFGLTKTKFHHQRKVCLEKKGWSLCREEHLANYEAWRMESLCFGVVWQLGAQEILEEGKKEWIPPNIKTF